MMETKHYLPIKKSTFNKIQSKKSIAESADSYILRLMTEKPNITNDILTYEEIEEFSFRNLVLFYADELKRVVAGERLRNIFPNGAWGKKFCKMNILIFDSRISGAVKYSFTPEALEVLNGGK